MTVQGPVKEQQPDGMSHRGLEKWGFVARLCDDAPPTYHPVWFAHPSLTSTPSMYVE